MNENEEKGVAIVEQATQLTTNSVWENDEIKKLEAEIKEKEEQLKQAKSKMKKYQKYKHFIFSKYKEFGGEKYPGGLHKDYLIADIRNLARRIVSAKKECTYNGKFIVSFCDSKAVNSLNAEEIKICNDFIEELYPIVEKYVNIVIENMEE